MDEKNYEKDEKELKETETVQQDDSIEKGTVPDQDTPGTDEKGHTDENQADKNPPKKRKRYLDSDEAEEGEMRVSGAFIEAGSLKDFMEQLRERIFGDADVEMQSISVDGIQPADASDDDDSGSERKHRRETRRERRKREEKEQQAKDESALDKIRNFNYTPKQIKEYLDRFVISQEEAKKVLAIAICDHYNHVRRCLEDSSKLDKPHSKHNVLMIGPTGVGKTYLMRCLAKMLGVPFVKADATKYSETGYVGYDVDDIIRDLIKVTGGNVNLAQYGIVYIDEIDKIAAKNSNGEKDVSGRGVQINLLKIMEDSEIKVLSQSEMMNPMSAMMMRSGQPSTIHTKNILFIVSGAFDKISDIIRKRLGKGQIGFGIDNAREEDNESELLKKIQTQDLVNYGFEPEFVGRLPVRVALSDLDAEDLASILSSAENNVMQQYVEAFAGYGIELTILPEAVKEIAIMASKEKTGARGLLTILEHIFRDFKFELPGSGVTSFTVSASTVYNPRGTLELLLSGK